MQGGQGIESKHLQRYQACRRGLLTFFSFLIVLVIRPLTTHPFETEGVSNQVIFRGVEGGGRGRIGTSAVRGIESDQIRGI